MIVDSHDLEAAISSKSSLGLIPGKFKVADVRYIENL